MSFVFRVSIRGLLLNRVGYRCVGRTIMSMYSEDSASASFCVCSDDVDPEETLALDMSESESESYGSGIAPI